MEMKPKREFKALLFYYIGILLCVLLIAFSVINIVTENGNLILAISSIALAAFLLVSLLLNMFKIEYKIDEENEIVSVRAGTSREIFKFNEVKELERVKKFLPQGTLATNKIKITYKKNGTKDVDLHIVYISTTDDNAAFEYLKKKCHAAKIITPTLYERRHKDDKFNFLKKKK